MKTVMTLVMAVMVHGLVFAQNPLTREDSLVLAEANARVMEDSLTRVDSILHASIRTLDFPAAIDTILRDFPYNLKHITGELVLAQGEFENYASTIQVPDAEDCIVTKYHSRDDTTASWQAKMYSTDDWDVASRRYQQLFRKLKTCYIRLVDGSIINLEGDWEPAKEGASFTTSTLRLKTGDWRYREVKVELELIYRLADWAININIVSKKRDDRVGDDNVVENE